MAFLPWLILLGGIVITLGLWHHTAQQTEAQQRDIYSAIVYLEPFDWRNQRAFGYDMYSEPTRRQAMAPARDSGAGTLSGKVTLVQGTEKDVQAGVLPHLPVYRDGVTPDDLAQRQAKLIGWAYSPLRLNDLISNLLKREHADLAGRMAIRIYDARQPHPEKLLFESQSIADAPGLQSIMQIGLGGQPWTVEAQALPGFFMSSGWAGEQIIVIAGLVLSAALAALVSILIRSRNQVAGALAQVIGAIRDRVRREYITLVHPDEQDIGRRKMHDLLTAQVQFASVERRFCRLDTHTEFWGHLTAKRLTDSDGQLIALVVVIADITELKSKAEELAQHRDRLEHLIPGSAFPLMIGSGCLQRSNKSMVRRRASTAAPDWAWRSANTWWRRCMARSVCAANSTWAARSGSTSW